MCAIGFVYVMKIFVRIFFLLNIVYESFSVYYSVTEWFDLFDHDMVSAVY